MGLYDRPYMRAEERGEPATRSGRPPRWTIVVAIALVVVLIATGAAAIS
jgi:hypothetical protein